MNGRSIWIRAKWWWAQSLGKCCERVGRIVGKHSLQMQKLLLLWQITVLYKSHKKWFIYTTQHKIWTFVRVLKKIRDFSPYRNIFMKCPCSYWCPVQEMSNLKTTHLFFGNWARIVSARTWRLATSLDKAFKFSLPYWTVFTPSDAVYIDSRYLWQF